MEQYINFIIMGAVGLFAIMFGVWFHWKFTEKQRKAKKEAKAREKAQKLAAKRAAAGESGDDDFEEEFMEHQDNSLPDDSDGEFKDTNLFGMKKKKDGPDVFQDWD